MANSDVNSKSKNFCSECNKMFSRVSNLRVHVAKLHPDKVNVIAAKAPEIYECDICRKKFRTKKYFKDHNRTHVPVTIHKLKLTCSMCDYFSEESKELIEHFKNVHDVNVVTSRHEFLTYSDFEVWKKQVEHDRKDEYVKGRSDWTTKEKLNKKYQCHRSGNFVSNSKGLRHLKTQGSKKIGAFCPASMKVAILSDGKCLVTYCETHVGHQNDLCHINLTSEEREDLATKILMKTSFNKILKDVRQLASKSDLKRIHLLTKKDLYNIKQRKYLKSSSVCHKNVTAIDCVNTEAVAIESEVRVSQDCGDMSIEQEVMVMRNQMMEYLDNISTKDEVAAMKKLMAQMGSVLAAVRSGNTTLTISPKNKAIESYHKKIVPQRRLCSVKRNKISVEMPSREGSQRIALSTK